MTYFVKVSAAATIDGCNGWQGWAKPDCRPGWDSRPWLGMWAGRGQVLAITYKNW